MRGFGDTIIVIRYSIAFINTLGFFFLFEYHTLKELYLILNVHNLSALLTSLGFFNPHIIIYYLFFFFSSSQPHFPNLCFICHRQ